MKIIPNEGVGEFFAEVWLHFVDLEFDEKSVDLVNEGFILSWSLHTGRGNGEIIWFDIDRHWGFNESVDSFHLDFLCNLDPNCEEFLFKVSWVLWFSEVKIFAFFSWFSWFGWLSDSFKLKLFEIELYNIFYF